MCHFQYVLSVVKYNRGELMVHIKDEIVQSPGDVIKYARQKSGLTMEEPAEKIKVSSRYL